MPPTTIRRAVLVLVAALALLGSAAYAALKPDLSVAPSPASQTVSQGQAATYTVTVNRLNGLTAPITLKVANLPTGVTPSWDGVAGSSLSIPSGANVVTLKLQTSSSTRAGTIYPTITATSGSLTRLTALTMVVESASTPNFTLAAVPASRTILQGESALLSVNVSRAGGFTGPVALGLTGLPAGIAATWRLPDGTAATAGSIPAGVASASLELVSQRSTPTGSFPLVILASGKPAATTITRFAAATLIVQPTLSFQIAGTPPRLLAPGVRAPLDLRLTNPYGFPLKVTSLAVGVEEATSRPGCSGTANFRATGPRAVGFVLPAQAKDVPLSTLIGASSLPTVEMLDTDAGQEACIDTAVTLQYSGERVAMTRGALTLLLTAGALLAVSASALAYWVADGSGRGAAGTGTLAAPAVSVPATSGRSVAVHWDAQATLDGAAIPEATYRVQRKGPGEPGYTTVTSGGCAAPIGYPASECADSVPADGAYAYRVVAVYRSWTAISAPRSVDVVPAPELAVAEATSPAEPAATESARPAAPEGVTATAAAGGDITLAWDAVPGAESYRVYRRTATGSYGDPASVSATEFRDPGSGLTDGERYVYMVRAVAGLESLDSAEAEARSDSRAPAYGASAVALPGDGGWINAANATDASVQVELSGPGQAGDVVEVTVRDTAGAEVKRRAPLVAGIGSVTVGGIDASPLAEVSSSVADPAGARNLQVTATVADDAGNVNAAATATAPAGKDVTAPPASGPGALVVTYSDGRLAGSGEPFDTISAVREGGDGTVHAGGTVQADGTIPAFAVGALAPGETGVFQRVTETDPAGNALTLAFGPFAG